MSRSPTADNKLLALLERMPGPLATGEIAEALGWSRDNVLLVAWRLVHQRRVERFEGECEGGMHGSGRPPLMFALAGLAGPADARPAAALAPNTYVVTPTGEEARIVRTRGSFAEFEYVTGPERFQRGTLHVRLLKPFQPGRERPAPARVVA